MSKLEEYIKKICTQMQISEEEAKELACVKLYEQWLLEDDGK